MNGYIPSRINSEIVIVQWYKKRANPFVRIHPMSSFINVQVHPQSKTFTLNNYYLPLFTAHPHNRIHSSTTILIPSFSIPEPKSIPCQPSHQSTAIHPLPRCNRTVTTTPWTAPARWVASVKARTVCNLHRVRPRCIAVSRRCREN